MELMKFRPSKLQDFKSWLEGNGIEHLFCGAPSNEYLDAYIRDRKQGKESAELLNCGSLEYVKSCTTQKLKNAMPYVYRDGSCDSYEFLYDELELRLSEYEFDQAVLSFNLEEFS